MSTPGEELEPERHAAPRARALVVDDDTIITLCCAEFLCEQGFACDAVGTAVEALELLEREPYDLLVCDLVMPAPGGLAVIEAADRLLKRPAIVVITAISKEGLVVPALRLGGCQVLFKPIDPGELASAAAWALHARIASGVSRDDLEALHGMATAANAEESLPRALDRILALCVSTLRADAGTVLLSRPGPSGPELTIAASYGLSLRPRFVPTPGGAQLASWVAQQRRPIRLAGPLSGYPLFAHLQSNPNAAESIVAPILWRQEALGTLSVSSRRDGVLGAERMALVIGACDIAAAAIYRDQLEREREHQDRLALIGQMTAGVAHELANPLTYTTSNLDFLTERLAQDEEPWRSHPALREELAQLVNEAADGVRRMSVLAEDLRTTSRRPTEEAALTDLDALVRRAQVLVHPQLKHRVELVLDLAAPAPVLADPGRLLQVILNLVVNAGQAVGRGGRVQLRTREVGATSIVEVEDNGPGIPPGVRDRVFDPFFTTKPANEGTGLGLAIARQISRACGGDLTFADAAGGGTTFTLALPSHRAGPQAQSRLPVVLLIDDDANILRALTRRLQDEFEVLSAESGATALDLVRGKTLDVIVSDYSMPHRNGLEVIAALRQAGHHAPALLLTAVAASDEVQRALAERQISGVHPKPWNLAELVAALHALVGR